jgi:hypothetical protein
MRVATGTLPHATFVHPCTSAPHSCNWAPPWTESVSRSGQLDEAQVRAHANPPVPGQAHSVPIAFPGESARLQQAQNVPVTRTAPGEIRAASTASQPLIPGQTPQLPPIVAVMPLTVDGLVFDTGKAPALCYCRLVAQIVGIQLIGRIRINQPVSVAGISRRRFGIRSQHRVEASAKPRTIVQTSAAAGTRGHAAVIKTQAPLSLAAKSAIRMPGVIAR